MNKYKKIILYLIVAFIVSACGGGGGESAVDNDATSDNQSPSAQFTVDDNEGVASHTVMFDASSSSDSDGTIRSYEWDFGDGQSGEGVTTSHTYTTPGDYIAVLTVTDNDGRQNISVAQLIRVTSSTNSPIAAFSVDAEIGDTPLTVYFAASNSNTSYEITSYEWDFGDGTTGTGQQVTHIYTAKGITGIYRPSLTVTTNSGGEFTNNEQIIRVLPTNAVPIASYSVDVTSGEVPLVVTFDGSSSTDGDGVIRSYSWDFGDGATSTEKIVTHTYTTPGNYAVVLTITDDDDATDNSTAQIINALVPNVAPTSQFAVDVTSGDIPLTVSFDGSSSTDSDGVVQSYSWDFGDGSSGTGQQTTHTFNQEGIYFTYLVVTDNDGDVATSVSKVIRALPPNEAPTAAFSVDTTTGDIPLTVNFNAITSTDADGTIESYVWDFGDGNSSTGQLVSHTYTTAGSYSATLIVTDDDGAQGNSFSTLITPQVPNELPVAGFSVNVDTGDAPLTVNFNSSSSSDSDGTLASYEWDLGDGNTSSATNVTYVYSTPGVYLTFLTVTDDDGGTDISEARIIKVYPANGDPIASLAVDDDIGNTPHTVNFDASNSSDSDGTIVSYEWDFGDGTSGVGQQIAHTYTISGNHTATLTVTDNEGGQATDTHVIRVSIPNVPPTATFTTDVTTGSTPLTVNFDGSASNDPDGTIVSYAWDYGDGNNGTGVTSSHQYENLGTYEATLTVTDNSGFMDTSNTVTIQVVGPNSLPTAVMSVDTSSGTVPLTVTFNGSTSSDPDGTISIYEWDFGDGFKNHGAQVSHTYFEAGSHTAELTVTDDRGGQHSVTTTINVAANGGGFAITGEIWTPTAAYMDSDTNDLNDTYQSNNTPATAQVVRPSSYVNGFVTKEATQVEGQRFAYTNDEIDFYRKSMPEGHLIALYVHEYIDENGVEGGNDLDLYLYSVDDTSTPVATSLGSSDFEYIYVPSTGDYYIAVVAHRGKSTYQISSLIVQSSLNEKNVLRLEDEFVTGEIVAKTIDTQTNGPALPGGGGVSDEEDKIDLLASQNSLITQSSNVDRSSLFQIDAPVQALSNSSNSDLESPFDGRYGITLSQEALQAYRTIKKIKSLRLDERIDYAEPNYILEAFYTPNDVNYNKQWHYDQINLPEAWDISMGDSQVIVAVIDTGVVMSHEDLSGNLLSTGYDFISSTVSSNDGDGIDADPDDPGDGFSLEYSSWHGTHVSGTVAATTDNNIGVAGVAPNVKIMPIRVLGKSGGTSYDIEQSIRYAAGLSNDSLTVPPQTADIINMSLGGGYPSSSVQDSITEAYNSGVVIVAAAGNSNTDSWSYPASYEGVISVAAVGHTNERSSYSNYGTTIDLAAPGGDNNVDNNNDGKPDSTTILSTGIDTSLSTRASSYEYMQGTSMAAPHVAGVVALMKSAYSGLTPSLLDALIQNGMITTDVSGDGAAVRNNDLGYGVIDAHKAVQKATDLAGGAAPPEYAQATVGIENDNMVSINTQTITLTKLTGTLSVSYTQLNYAWATLTELSTDVDGMGTYTLTIDRNSLSDGVYPLRVSFVMASGQVYSKIINVTQSVTDNSITDYGPVYVLLLDEGTKEVVYQSYGQYVNGERIPINIENLPDGNYLLYAGTDTDGDKILGGIGELYTASGSLSTPTTITINGADADVGFVTFSSHEQTDTKYTIVD